MDNIGEFKLYPYNSLETASNRNHLNYVRKERLCHLEHIRFSYGKAASQLPQYEITNCQSLQSVQIQLLILPIA